MIWSHTRRSVIVWDHKEMRRRNKELINDQTRFGSFFSFFKFHFTTSLKNRSWTSHRKKMYLISFLLALTSIYMERREMTGNGRLRRAATTPKPPQWARNCSRIKRDHEIEQRQPKKCDDYAIWNFFFSIEIVYARTLHINLTNSRHLSVRAWESRVIGKNQMRFSFCLQ